MKRIVVIALAILLAACATSEAPAPNRLYAVVFDITLDPQGKFVDAKVAQVTDVDSGSTAAVNVPVPEEYLAKARAELAAGPYSAGREHVFMYRYYKPARPGEVLRAPF